MAIAATFACTEKQNLVPEARPENLKEFSFTASFEQDDATKTVLNADLSVDWVINDSIAVYDGSGIREFIVREIREDKTAVICGLADASASSFYAVYPKKSLLEAVADTLKLALPGEQIVPAGMNVSPDALVSFAKLDSESGRFKFKNMTSLVKVTIPKEASRILVKNLGGIASSGTATLTANPEVIPAVQAISGSTTTSIVPESGKFAVGSYFIPVIPSEFPAGIAISVAQEDGYLVAETTDSLALVRNGGLDFGDISASKKTILAPFNIGSVEDLKAFTARAPYYAATDVITITADIDLQGEEWICAPNTRRYYGSIDGGKHRIYNYIVKSGPDTGNPSDAAVFGRIGLGKEESPYFIKDLAFGSKDYDFETKTGTYDGVSKVIFNTQNDGNNTYFYPGAIAYCYAFGTIENLASFTPVEIPASCTSPHRGSPLLGTVKANVTIRGCRNFGDIVEATATCTKNPTVGGISGALDGADCVVEDCVNEGNVTVSSTLPSDFGGLLGYTNYVATCRNCVNKGDVIAVRELKVDTYIGGISSRCTKKGTILENLKNEGNLVIELSGAFSVFGGGITARVQGATVTDCDNSGNINVNYTCSTSKKYLYLGGCFANSATAANTIAGCDNSGVITVNGTATGAYVGGVVGYNAFELSIEDCHNSGNISYNISGKTKNEGVAGVLMYSTAKVSMKDCSNSGNISYNAPVTTNTCVGGISGIFGGKDHSIENCENSGNISVIADKNSTAGSLCTLSGIISCLSNAPISGCKNNNCLLEAGADDAAKAPLFVVGGISGGSYYAHGAITDCSVSGTAINTDINTKEAYIGGICGILSHSDISNCSFDGSIVASGSANVAGGIAGAGLAAGTNWKEMQAITGGNGLVSKANITANDSPLDKVGTVVGFCNSTTIATLGATEPVVASEATINGAAGPVIGSASTGGLTINVAQ